MVRSSSEERMRLEDLQIRKYWLTSLFIGTVLTLVHLVIATRFDPTMVPFKTLILFLTTLFTMGFNYFFYVCAYKRYGTKLLTFFLILVPIFSMVTLYVYLFRSVPVSYYFPFYWVFQALSWVICAVQYVLNWKMRKINLRLKQQNLPT